MIGPTSIAALDPARSDVDRLAVNGLRVYSEQEIGVRILAASLRNENLLSAILAEILAAKGAPAEPVAPIAPQAEPVPAEKPAPAGPRRKGG